MSLTLCVVRIGNVPYERYTLPFIEAYCQRCGYVLVEINLPPPDGRSPSWQKLLAREFFPTAESLAVMDLDILPLPWAEPVHPFIDPARLTLSQITLSGRCNYRFRRAGIAEPWRFSNGWMGLPVSSRKLLREVYKSPDAERVPYAEMLALCRALQERNTPPALLPVRFNVVVRWGLPAGSRVRAIHAAHFAGDARHKSAVAERVYRKYVRWLR